MNHEKIHKLKRLASGENRERVPFSLEKKK